MNLVHPFKSARGAGHLITTALIAGITIGAMVIDQFELAALGVGALATSLGSSASWLYTGTEAPQPEPKLKPEPVVEEDDNAQ